MSTKETQQENKKLKKKVKELEDLLGIKQGGEINKRQIFDKIMNKKMLKNSDATTYELVIAQLVHFVFDKSNPCSFRLEATEKLLREMKEMRGRDDEEMW